MSAARVRRRTCVRPGSDRGASAVEYGLIVVAIAAIVVVVVFSIGRVTASNMRKTCDVWKTQEASACR